MTPPAAYAVARERAGHFPPALLDDLARAELDPPEMTLPGFLRAQRLAAHWDVMFGPDDCDRDP